MTPPRLYELACPHCDGRVWTIDSDFRGIDGVQTDVSAGDRMCAACHRGGPGWRIHQASPPAFFLQPHRLYPMAQAEFDYWVARLREHFPGDDTLQRPDFRPFLPEEAEADRRRHEASYPVYEMRDQDGARRADPEALTTREWVEIMVPGDWLVFRRHGGQSLCIERGDHEYTVRWRLPSGDDAVVLRDLTLGAACEVARLYLDPRMTPLPDTTGADSASRH